MSSSAEDQTLPVDKGNVQEDPVIVICKLQFGKTCTDLSMSLSATVGDLKQEAHELLGIPPAMQKLLIKGQMKPDGTTLQEAGIKRGLRVMLIGSRPQDLLSAAAPTSSPGLAWDSPVLSEEDPVHTQTQHKKILDKGKPEGCMPGVAGRQVQLKQDENIIPNLLNGQGNKVRLTFKLIERQIWMGSAASTQKVYYSQIKKIESHVVEGHEEYSMVAFHLNAEGKSAAVTIDTQLMAHVAALLANGRMFDVLVNGRHAWEISSLFGQGSCGRAATSASYHADDCSEETND